MALKATGKMTTVIAEQTKFPDLNQDDRIETLVLLDASVGVTNIIEKMGKQFAFSKADMSRNIEKIRKLYDANPQQYLYLDTLLEEEKKNGTTTADESATNSGVWLKRGLEFVCEFLWEIVKEYEECTKPYPRKAGIFKTLMRNAYDKTLLHHHNFAAKMLFKGAVYVCPYKEQVLSDLAFGETELDDQVIADMKAFEAPLREFCHALGNLYKRYGDSGPVIKSYRRKS